MLRQLSTILCCFALPALSAADCYGGSEELKGQATGFFHLEQIAGRSYFVTPEGNGFISLGVNHIAQAKLNPAVFREVYHDSDQEYATAVIANLRAWHYNTVGYNPLPAMTAMAMPFVQAIPTIGPCSVSAVSPYVDLFSPETEAVIDELVRKTVVPLANNPWLVGWNYIDCPLWNIEGPRRRNRNQDQLYDFPAFIKRLPATAPGKIAYVDFLQERYAGSIAALNQAYGKTFTDWPTVAAESFAVLSTQGSAEYADDTRFLGVIARRYYSLYARTVRRYDSNHLILGDRYAIGIGFPADEVLAAAGLEKWVDVASVQPDYMHPEFPTDVFETLWQKTGRPVLIGDHDFLIANGADRAKAHRDYVMAAFQRPYIVGYHKCEYADRGAAYAVKSPHGLIDTLNRPRLDYIVPAAATNAEIYRKVYGADASAKTLLHE